LQVCVAAAGRVMHRATALGADHTDHGVAEVAGVRWLLHRTGIRIVRARLNAGIVGRERRIPGIARATGAPAGMGAALAAGRRLLARLSAASAGTGRARRLVVAAFASAQIL